MDLNERLEKLRALTKELGWDRPEEEKKVPAAESAMPASGPKITVREAAKMEDEELLNYALPSDGETPDPSQLPKPQRVAYVAHNFDIEVLNGGLSGYFVNQGWETAPYLEEALTELGAEEYWKLFQSFITKNGIDINDLGSLDCDDDTLQSRYSFDDFDDTYGDLSDKHPLDALCAAYMRKHLKEFFS